MENLDLVLEARRLHIQAARLAASSGAAYFAALELAKADSIRSGRFKRQRQQSQDRLSRLLRDFCSLSKRVSDDLSAALLRSGRDLSSLHLQKGWDIDADALLFGIEAIRRSGDATDLYPQLDRLRDFAVSLGAGADIDPDLVEDFDNFARGLEGQRRRRRAV